MFTKDNNVKKIELNVDKLYQDNNILLSASLVEMMNSEHHNQEMQDKIDYQSNITAYINRKHEYDIKKQYNPRINELYQNGLLVVNGNEFRLKDFFIVFDDNLNNFHIKCINSKFENEEIDYNRAVRFIDTTAFISLINSQNVTNNRIILDNIESLNNIVANWDGYLHDETLETDAIINKKMIRDKENE